MGVQGSGGPKKLHFELLNLMILIGVGASKLRFGFMYVIVVSSATVPYFAIGCYHVAFI